VVQEPRHLAVQKAVQDGRRGAPTVVGVTLMIYPYFVSTALGVVAIVLVAAGTWLATRLARRGAGLFRT